MSTMQQNSELAGILHAGSFLINPARSTLPSDLQELLVSRLTQYHVALEGHKQFTPMATLEELQLETAKQSLFVVERVQQILTAAELPTPSPSESLRRETNSEGAPVIGTRDLAQLRTLLSITFKWGVEPLLVLVTSTWPNHPYPTVISGPKIIDLTTKPLYYKQLSSLLVRLLILLFPGGVHGSFSQTLITAMLLNRHLTDLLKPCIALGWLPISLSSEATPTVDEIRPNIMRLLEMYVLFKIILYYLTACLKS
jgi:hypothetical protein